MIGVHVTFGFLARVPRGHDMLAALAVHLATLFGVPLFLALSMVGLSTRDARLTRFDGGWLRFLRERAARLLPAYVTWSMVTIARDDRAMLLQPSRLVTTLITGTADEQFYFIPLIFELYVVWPALSRLARAAGRSPVRAVLVALSGILVSVGWWSLSARGLAAGGVLTMPLYWFAWVAVGLAIAPHIDAVLRWALVSRAGFAALPATLVAWVYMVWRLRAELPAEHSPADLSIAATVFQFPVLLYSLTAMALFLVVATRAARTRVAAALIAVGRRSYGIFLVHVLVLEMVVYRIVGSPSPADFDGWTWPLKLVAIWASCLLASDVLVRVLARGPLRVIAGVPPSHDRSDQRRL